MNRSECLDKAKEIVNGARQENYGSPEKNFANIALYWSVYLSRDIKPTDVALMMVLMKLARLENKPDHEDSWIDIAGYAANGAELATRRAEIDKSFDTLFVRDEKDKTKADKEKLDAWAESRGVCCGG